MATTHLLRLGHRRVALLIDETGWTTGAGRLAGYRRAHAQAGIEVDDELVSVAGFALDVARAAVALLLDRNPDVTAIFAANNVLAQAAFIELQARKMSVPRSLSLVAYDDVPWMRMVRPTITTVVQHADEMGRRAADLLIARLQPDQERPPITLLVNPSLIVRDSTAIPTTVGVGARSRRR